MTGDRNITLSHINEISDALRFVRCYSRILRQLILDTAGNDEEGEAAAILVTQLDDHVERLNTAWRKATADGARDAMIAKAQEGISEATGPRVSRPLFTRSPDSTA